MRTLYSLGLLIMFVGFARGQDRAVIIINTNLPEAIVYIDAARAETAQGRIFGAAPGTRTVRLIPPSFTSWSIAPVTRTVTLAEGDTTRLVMPFPLYHHVESTPAGASVFVRSAQARTPVGHTPVTYSAFRTPGTSLEVAYEGYQTQEIPLRTNIWNRYSITLLPVDDGGGQSGAAHLQVRRTRWWIDAAAVGLAVAGGILAVHYKFQADRLDDDYRQSGDPSLRPRIARLDDRSAIALGGMQVGLITLGVRFYLRQ